MTSFSVRDTNPSVLVKVPKKHKIMSNGTSYHDTPLPLVPWYPCTMVPCVPWVPLVPKVPWYHATMNSGPSFGGRRPTYPGGCGGGAPRAKRKKGCVKVCRTCSFNDAFLKISSSGRSLQEREKACMCNASSTNVLPPSTIPKSDFRAEAPEFYSKRFAQSAGPL